MGNCIVFSPAKPWSPGTVTKPPRNQPPLLAACLSTNNGNSGGATGTCPCSLTSRKHGLGFMEQSLLVGPPKHVVILGGGPVGLSLALRLVEGEPSNVSVVVYDHRWAQGEDGAFQWPPPQHNERPQDSLVVTLPDALVGLFANGSAPSKAAYTGERVWPGSRNVAVQSLQERLLARVQERDVSHRITLAKLPEGPLWDSLELERRAPETSVIVATEEAGPFAQEALEEEFDVPLASPVSVSVRGTVVTEQEHFLLVGLQEAFMPNQCRKLSAAISCAQNRYFYNPDIYSGYGHLSIRLSPQDLIVLQEAASKHLFKHTVKPQSIQTRLVLMEREVGAASTGELAKVYEQAPRLKDIISVGIHMFGLSETLIISLRIVSEPPLNGSMAFTCTSSRGFRACMLPGGGAGCDAAPRSSGLPGRGLRASLEGADALARVLHRSMPMSTFECFMQCVRVREPSDIGAEVAQPQDLFRKAEHSSRAGFVKEFEAAVHAWKITLSSAEQTTRTPRSSAVAKDWEALEFSRFSDALLASFLDAITPPAPFKPQSARQAWLQHLQEGTDSLAVAPFARALDASTKLALSLPDEALKELGAMDGRWGRDPTPSARQRPAATDLLTLIVRAEALLRLGQYVSASEACKEALLIDPENSLALLVHAEVSLRLGLFQKAAADSTAVIEREKGSPAAYAVRAEAKLRMGRYDEAIFDCNRAEDQGKRTVAVLSVRGCAYQNLGRFEEAVRDCSYALALSPYCAEALSTRGQAMLEIGDQASAVKDLTRALEIVKSAQAKLMAPPFAGEDRQHASETQATVLPRPTTAKGRTPRSARRPAPAAKADDLFLADTLAARADALLSVQRYDEAIEDCDEALKLHESSILFAVRGEAKLLSSHFADAIQDCNAALALEPNDPYTYAVRAQSHLLLGKIWEAEQDCDMALEIFPELEYAVKVRERARASHEKNKQPLA